MQLLKLKRNDRIGLFLFIAFVISSSLIWLFEERFDKNSWRSEPSKRYQMVDDVIESQLLMHKSKNEVILLLGQPNSKLTGDQDVFLYRLGTPPSFFQSKPEQLLIAFRDDRVLKVSLAIEQH